MGEQPAGASRAGLGQGADTRPTPGAPSPWPCTCSAVLALSLLSPSLPKGDLVLASWLPQPKLTSVLPASQRPGSLVVPSRKPPRLAAIMPTAQEALAVQHRHRAATRLCRAVPCPALLHTRPIVCPGAGRRRAPEAGQARGQVPPWEEQGRGGEEAQRAWALRDPAPRAL